MTVTRQVSLCIAGFGNAAQTFCQMLVDRHQQLEKEYNVTVLVKGIAGRSKGSLLNPRGIDITQALEMISKEGAFSKLHPHYHSGGTLDIIDGAQADVLVELTTLSMVDGQPAIQHIEKAFALGMDVITANKGPIAWDFHRLNRLACVSGRQFLYETVVMDGAPVFNLVRKTLPGCRVLSFKGILNSTTNFILEALEQGMSYEKAVSEAQRQGFAEADPSLDVEGWDAAAKTSALMNTLMNARVTPTDIQRTGITHLKESDIKKARHEGSVIKLICAGWRDQEKVLGSVQPLNVPMGHLFSTIDATSSVLTIETDLMGEISLVEHSPTLQQTAYGIFSDLLTLLGHPPC